MDRLDKFETLVSQSQVALAIFRAPVPGSFMLCDISASTDPIADLVARDGFVGLIGLVGLKPRTAFAVELTSSEFSAIHASFISLFERALISAESSLTGLNEDFLKKLHILPQNLSMEEN